MTDNHELLPCPFCGGSARLISGEGFADSCVACNDCGACTDDMTDDETVVTHWNTRKQTDPAEPGNL